MLCEVSCRPLSDGASRAHLHPPAADAPSTGKSLSLISACLYWLLEHHPAQLRAQESASLSRIHSVGTGQLLPDWVGAQTAATAAAIRAEKAAKESALRDVVAQQSHLLERRAAALDKAAASQKDTDDEFLLDGGLDAYTGRAPQLSPAQEIRLAALAEQQEIESELLHAPDTPVDQKIRLIYARVERSAEMKRLSLGQQVEDEVGDMLAKMLRPDKPRRRPQIIYASRTHSQLVQMVGEIKKLKYGRTAQEEKSRRSAPVTRDRHATGNWQTAAGMQLTPATAAVPASPPSSPGPHEVANSFDPLLQAKVISLGSRSNLCIRPSFAHLRKADHSMRLNDSCLDLQKQKAAAAAAKTTSAAAGCEFLHAAALPIFHDHVLAKVHDLEEMVVKGNQLHFCPYYGSRNASPEADVLIVPYASLLSAATRASLQIDLDDAIICIDEAHNLHDTINEIYSCRVTHRQLRESRAALRKYLDKFQARLAPVNKANVELLLRVCDAFILALHHSHTEAHRQWQVEQSRGSAFSSRSGVRDLNDIFSDGAQDGIHMREQAAKRNRTTGGATSTTAALLDKASQQVRTSSSSGVGSARCSYSLIKSLTHFNASLGVEDINYHHVEAWMEKSEICKKMKGYIDRERAVEAEAAARMQQRFNTPATTRTNDRPDAAYESTSISPLAPVLDFIRALSNVEGDGRVCVDIRVDGVAAQVHPDSSLRFLMLNPAVHLTPIIKAARTIILAGGTMQPFDTFKYQLFPAMPTTTATTTSSSTQIASPTPPPPPHTPTPDAVDSKEDDRLHFFSCSHVIPPSHIQSLILRSGPGASKSRPFNFQSSLRGENARLDDLAATIVNLINVIPQGVVVFFTSYAFAAQVMDYWATHAGQERRVYESEKAAAAAGAKAAAPAGGTWSAPVTTTAPTHATWLERMRKKKCIFRDAQGVSFEEVLDAYTKIIRQCDNATTGSDNDGPDVTPRHTPPAAPSFTDATLRPGQTGALLFSVVGGKMSEGINFSDGLARAVIMVGLPYPNAHDPEMKEKTAYADRDQRRRETAARHANSTGGVVARAHSQSAGHQLLNTLCMRAVNQSIGRAIRHARDYASIILLDERYLRADVLALLPRWIKTDSFQPAGLEFVDAFKAVGTFFRDRTRTNTVGTHTDTGTHDESEPNRKRALDQPQTSDRSAKAFR